MNKKIKLLVKTLIAIFLIYTLYLVIYRIRAYPYDELWNFNNIYKMYNGYRIYESTNVIITPLFYYIGLVWMKLFSPTVISIRYLGVVIFILMYFIIYRLFKVLNVSKPSIAVGISLLLIRSFQIITNSANYNFLSLTFFYLGLLIVLSKNFKIKDYILGLVYFLIFMSKQNMAFYFILVTLIYDFYKRENFKNFILSEIKRIAVFIVLTGLFILIYYKVRTTWILY